MLIAVLIGPELLGMCVCVCACACVSDYYYWRGWYVQDDLWSTYPGGVALATLDSVYCVS